MICRVTALRAAPLLVLAIVAAACDGKNVSAPKELRSEPSYVVVLDPALPAAARSAVTEIVSLTENERVHG